MISCSLNLKFLNCISDVFSFCLARTEQVLTTSQKAMQYNQSWTWLTRYCHKIVVVELDVFPERAHQDGHIIERLIRDYLGTVGLSQIIGLRRSDLFILTDADELPTRDVVEFLRWHDGYTQPVLFSYR
jgi:Glycosyltransferase family 17